LSKKTADITRLLERSRRFFGEIVRLAEGGLLDTGLLHRNGPYCSYLLNLACLANFSDCIALISTLERRKGGDLGE
jgi:hypothetical protein